jgi:ribose-phosphate pyrophosphokinase
VSLRGAQRHFCTKRQKTLAFLTRRVYTELNVARGWLKGFGFLWGVWIFASIAQASPWVIGVQGNESATAAFASGYGLTLAHTRSKVFSDRNIGVTIDENVAYDDVYVVLPSILTADQWMEALLFSHTAQTLFAQRVLFASPAEPDEWVIKNANGARIELPVSDLSRVAGISGTVRIGSPRLEVKKLPQGAAHSPPITEGPAVVLEQGHPELARQIAQGIGAPLASPEDEALLSGRHCYFVAGVDEPLNENLFQTMARIARLRSRGNSIHLVTPYLPYARADKIDQDGVGIAGSAVVRFFQAVGASQLTLVRAHAPQSQGFFEGASRQLTARPTVLDSLKERGVTVVVSPDEGAQKDATRYAKFLGLQKVAVINKERDLATGEDVEIKGISHAEAIPGQIVVIIDDEVGSGKTLAKAAAYLKKLGAIKVYALVTHVTGDARAALECEAIAELIVTDTIPVHLRHPKLTVLPIWPEIVDWLGPLEARRHAYHPGCPERLAAASF